MWGTPIREKKLLTPACMVSLVSGLHSVACFLAVVSDVPISCILLLQFIVELFLSEV